jgi:DNA polymerase-3 subunit delta
MTGSTPVVYVLHGDDEFAIAQFISEMEAKLGDPSLADLNVTRLDGRTLDPEELLSIASAIPFLVTRRIVVLTQPLARLNSEAARQKFLETLEKIPASTALLVVVNHLLTEERRRSNQKPHWLEQWAVERPEHVFLRAFSLPKGPGMSRWIQKQAKTTGGQFTKDAADLLASLVGDDPRLADQEIHKLLAYVNFNRPVEQYDVQALTADSGQGDIFAMVDWLGNQDGRRAMGMLHRLLEQQDAFSIFGMVVRQFRLLLLARDALDRGAQTRDLARVLKVPPFVAEKIEAQARHFSLPALESIYHQLLDLDEAMKTSQMPADLVLDSLVVGLTPQQPASHSRSH